MKVLVLAPHQDDEVLGCGGTILKMVEEGSNVGIMYFTDNWKNKERWLEYSWRAECACKRLGAQMLYFGDFPDQQLDQQPFVVIVSAIEEIITNFRPDLVLIPSHTDLNRDHRIVNEAASVALRKANVSFWEYYVPSASEYVYNEQFAPNVFVRLSWELVCKKAEVFSQVYYHEVQGETFGRSANGIETTAKFFGMYRGWEAAEAFSVRLSIVA